MRFSAPETRHYRPLPQKNNSFAGFDASASKHFDIPSIFCEQNEPKAHT
jgi:hypothetical protein